LFANDAIIAFSRRQAQINLLRIVEAGRIAKRFDQGTRLSHFGILFANDAIIAFSRRQAQINLLRIVEAGRIAKRFDQGTRLSHFGKMS